MKTILLAIAVCVIMPDKSNANDRKKEKILKEIQNKTWTVHNSLYGENIVFIKTDNGSVKAIRQINGLMVGALYTIIHDVEIRNDTIRLLDGTNEEAKAYQKGLLLIYKKRQGLFQDNEKVDIMHHKRIIFGRSEYSKMLDTMLFIDDLTKLSLDDYEVYDFNGRKYSLKRKE